VVDPAEHRGHPPTPPGCPRIRARPSPNTGSTSEYRRDHPLTKRRRPTEYRLDHLVTNEGDDGPRAEYGRDHPVSLPLIPCNRGAVPCGQRGRPALPGDGFLGGEWARCNSGPSRLHHPRRSNGTSPSVPRPSAEPPVPPGPSPVSAGRRPLRATRPQSPTEDGRSGPSPSSTRTPPLRPTAEPTRGAGSPASLARAPSQAGPEDRGRRAPRARTTGRAGRRASSSNPPLGATDAPARGAACPPPARPTPSPPTPRWRPTPTAAPAPRLLTVSALGQRPEYGLRRRNRPPFASP
jgi:hypothetical protein